jgi:hypothetical protein
MIIFLCSHFHRKTLKALLSSPACTVPVRVLSYRWLFARDTVPGATYVFTDHDRLAAHELAAAARAFHSMKAAGLRVLNDPAKVRTRFELLADLDRAGVNGFAAYRAALSPRPRSFPVFIRSEADHLIFSDELIEDQETLDERLAQLTRDGVPLRHLIVVEFSASPARPGVFRKHSVFKVGDQYLGYARVSEQNWAVKHGQRGLATDAELAEAVAEIDANPYAERVKPAFEIAHIDYGRVDFGLIGDRMSIFEINTNPALAEHLRHHRNAEYQAARQRMLDRIAATVSAPDTTAPPVKIAWERSWMKRIRFFAGPVLKQP